MQNNFRLRALRIATLAALFIGSTAHAAQALTIDVHRDANCGCCKKWIQHHVETNMSAVKQDLGVVPRLSSCHTAVINGKFVEGHVPAEQIIAMSKRNDLVGIAAPGMPAGSPGMEVDGKHDAYRIVGLTKAGTDQIIAEYPGT